MTYQDGLTSAAAELDPLAALREPTDSLLGVSPGARATLAALGIETIYDLAASSLFASAAEVAAAARESAGRFGAVGAVPGELVAPGAPTDPDEVAESDVKQLRSIGTANEAAVKQHLVLSTVADLGRWPPYVAARTVLRAAIGAPDADDAANLVPRLGEFPTERRYYSTVVIDHVENAAATDLATSGPVDITPAIAQDFGFSAPAVGARLTFAQSWYAHGLTLGNLLHSVALAPGESTRIAVLDWARQSRGSAVEGITESERLANETRHNRAVSEVQDAVATEVQTGFSRTESSATTKAAGGGFGFSAGPISVGGSASIGKSSTEAESFSSSFGSRSLSASMSQRVADATQQAASSVRDRRASIVQEVSESEHEGVSTRILANYNHMHALTVQYFEVVEVYRVVVDVHRVERCLFVPMKLIVFTDDVIQHYQGILADAALDRRARELLTTEFGVIRVSPAVTMSPYPNVYGRLEDLNLRAATETSGGGEGEAPAPAAAPAAPVGTDRALPGRTRDSERAIRVRWNADEVSRIGRLAGTAVMRPGRSDLFLPDEATLEGVAVRVDAENGPSPATPTISILRRDGSRVGGTPSATGSVTFPSAIPLADIDRLQASRGAERVRGQIVLELSYRGTRFPVSLPIDLIAGNGREDVTTFGLSEAGNELRTHLMSNRLHYSQAIWRSLDSSTIALLLSRFTWEGRAVSDQVDPTPILVAGNYLTFRMPGFTETAGIAQRAAAQNDPLAAARKAWADWLADHGVNLGREPGSEQLVPIPTGGVFAESVLGRSNSAEKLDATRFWNWQDSPIPLQPPEIAAITMQSRHDPGTTPTPGQLGQPVLNIVNPTALPDPTGVGAILGALQNGSMFRDMSGLAATIGLAQATGSDATTAGTEAGRQAQANLAVAAQKEVEMARIAAQVAMASMGLPSAGAGTPKNHSEMGALLNAASGRDGRTGAASPDTRQQPRGRDFVCDPHVRGTADRGGEAGDRLGGTLVHTYPLSGDR